MFELDPLEDILAGDLSESLVRRAAVVIDQNVGVRTGGDEFRARRRLVEIAQDFTNFNARRLAAVRARSVQGLLVAAVEHDRASGFRQRPRAGAAQAFA